MAVNRRTISSALLLVLMIALGIGSRFWLEAFPNFKPITGLALFAGFYFLRLPWALVAIVTTLLLSDLIIGTYEWPIALAVYGTFLLAGAAGFLLTRWVDRQSLDRLSVIKRTAGFALLAVAVSVVFFVATNFAVWLCWYERSWAGLGACFSAAVPFFRYTLAGDLLFSTCIVLAYQMVLWIVSVTNPQRASNMELLVESQRWR